MVKFSGIRFAPSIRFAKSHLKKALKEQYPGCEVSSVKVKRNRQRKYAVPHISGWKPYSIKATIKCKR